MAQNKKIKYTTMTAKALAKKIEEELKTKDHVEIENVLLPSKMKHGVQFIDLWQDYPTYYIELKEFDRDETDTTLKTKTITYKNCKLRDAELVIRSYSKYNNLDVIYDKCEVQHFNTRLPTGLREIRFIACKVQNCVFSNVTNSGPCRTEISTFSNTVFEYCVFEHCRANNFINRDGEKFANCKFNSCDFVGAELGRTKFVKCLADTHTTGFQLVCPEKGEYIAFKKARVRLYENGRSAISDYVKCKLKGSTHKESVIVELKIPADAKRSSATTRKCRASKAVVLSITSIDGKKRYKKAIAGWHGSEEFVYEVGKTVVPTNGFEENRWIECAPGIHHFITRDEAVAYDL